jgi:hypothetical protein
LFSFGIFTIVIAVIARWLQQQQAQVIIPQQANRKMLPPGSANSPLPALTNRQKER